MDVADYLPETWTNNKNCSHKIYFPKNELYCIDKKAFKITRALNNAGVVN